MKLNIGNKLRCLRHEKDITQEEFAEFLGVACQSVSAGKIVSAIRI